MSQIIVVGSLNMDLVVKAPRIPAPGETLQGQGLQIIPGGKGANQAVATARLGVPTAMVGRVGRDAFGPGLIDNLAAAGVDSSHIQTSPETATGTAIIIVADGGENVIVISAGANAEVGIADVQRAEALISGAELLLLQLEVPLETVQYATETAARHGTRVLLNPAPARELPPGLMSRVEVLIPNETEASLLTGVAVIDLLSARTAARKLLAMGPPTVIITLGANGALLATRDAMTHIGAARVRAVDTTAAGDALR